MVSRTLAALSVCVPLAAVIAPTAFADGILNPSPRPLGMGGAARGFATGDAGPQLNPSGISLMRAYLMEGSYQYGSALKAHDVRLSAVDSTSGFNMGGALYYNYHRDSPADGVNQTGHLFGGSLSFPLLDKIFFGGSAKYVRFADVSGTTHTGFTFDAGLTLRPIPQLSIGAAGYNLLDRQTPWAPRAVGGGVAVLPLPNLILLFDSVLEKDYVSTTRDKVVYYMGGGEFSLATAAAIRAGGGHDGMSGNNYVSAGVSTISAEIGALDLGLRQDVSGQKKTTVIGISARLFVPTM